MAAALAEAAGGGHLDYQEVPCAVEDVHGSGIRAGKLHPCPGWSHRHGSGDMGRDYLEIQPIVKITDRFDPFKCCRDGIPTPSGVSSSWSFAPWPH